MVGEKIQAQKNDTSPFYGRRDLGTHQYNKWHNPNNTSHLKMYQAH